MKTASVCRACWGAGTETGGAGCCPACQGIGAKIPVLSREEWQRATPAALDAAITHALSGLSMTRAIRARAALATFVARCALYQAPAARETTLVTLRGRGFALIANAAEARALAAAQRVPVPVPRAA